MSAPPRIFLSYARTDGHPHAAKLRKRLEPDFSVYQDLVNLEGGKDWWDQLKHAIDTVEYLVLVITTNSLKSEYVGKEWSYARQKGVCVIPVFDGPEPDFAALPHKWMRDAHFINIAVPEQWTVFVNQLSRRCQVARVPFMAEDLPAHYVNRPGEFNSLKTLILHPDKSTPVSIVAAKGAGGYGKTTLAKALCHDPEIQQVFHDGILWVTLGKDPGDLTTHVVNLIETLTGEKPGFSDLNSAATRLAELLSDNDLLLVIDDVWKPAHSAPFLRGGRNCVRLITTRDSATLPTESRNTQVDAMRGDEAVALLSKGLPAAPQQLRPLARKLGEWPLLLKLVNGILVRRTKDAKQPLKDAIAFVERKGLNAVDPEVIAKTLSISIEQLHPAEHERFAQLAIFPEDTPVSLAVVERLWSTDSDDTEQLCERLFELSLLLNLDLSARELRLHDVIRTWLRTQYPARLAEWNSALLERQPCTWSECPYHLNEAGRHEELRKLLFNFDWLQSKLEGTNVNALLQDLNYVSQTPSAKLLQSAIRLSAHVLGQHKNQLAAQLIGRLSTQDSGEIQAMLSKARLWRGARWFCPMTASLTPPGGPLMRTLTGHVTSVESVAVTPDGRRAISGSYGKTLKIWDLESGAEMRALEGHTDRVNAVAVTPDGLRAVSASGDHTLKVWELDSGIELCSLSGHQSAVTAVQVLPDGHRALSASRDHTLRMWDLDTGVELRVLTGDGTSLTALAVTPQATRAVSACAGQTLTVWDLDGGEELRTLRGHRDWVNAVAVTSDGRRAVSASRDHTLKIWDLDKGIELGTLTGHSGSVTAVALTPDGQRAVSASADQTLKVWDLNTRAELRSLSGHASSVNTLVLTPDGRRAISGSADSTLKIWNLDSDAEAPPAPGHSDSISALGINADGQFAVSASYDRSLKIWDLKSGAQLRRAYSLVGHTDAVNALAIYADGQRVISGSDDCTLIIWDLTSGRELRSLTGHARPVSSVAVTSDGRLAVSGSDCTLKAWDLESGAELCSLIGHADWISAVAVTADGRRAISGSDDRTLKVWDLNNGLEGHTLRGHTDRVSAVSIAPDGRRMISSSWDRSVIMWDLETGVELFRLPVQSSPVNAIAITPDNRRAVLGGWSNTLKLWDLQTAQLVTTFTGDSPMTACAVSPDNRTFIAGEASGRIHFLTLME